MEMELRALAFNVSGLEELCSFGFKLETTYEQGDKGIAVTRFDIFMLFDVRMNRDEVINKFPILQNYVTREYVCTPKGNDSDGKSCLLVRHLYGYKKELKKFCSFVTLVNQIVFKISDNIKNVRETYIIPVYLEKSEWESNFKKLKDQLLSLKHKNVVLIGDFNARVGNAQFLGEARENLPMSIKEKRRSQDVFLDDFGRNLIPWSDENLLTLLNGRTESDCVGRFTFGNKSTIDLCFVKGDLHKYVTDFGVIRERWGSSHSPIRASLKFVVYTGIPFSDILAAAIRPFEPYNKEESETKSSELFEKYKQQITQKLCFENLFKAFAKIEYKIEFWELAKSLDKCDFFGQKIELEALMFVRNVGELLEKVINEGLIYYLPLQRDELLDEDLSISDVLEITANINSHAIPPNEILIREDFYERAIKSFNFNQVEIPTASDQSISYLVNFTYYEIMLRRIDEWAKENIFRDHCVLGSDWERFIDPYERAFDSFFGNKVKMSALLCKLSFAGMSTKLLRKLENFMSNYDEYRKSDDFFYMGELKFKLSEVLYFGDIS